MIAAIAEGTNTNYILLAGIPNTNYILLMGIPNTNYILLAGIPNIEHTSPDVFDCVI